MNHSYLRSGLSILILFITSAAASISSEFLDYKTFFNEFRNMRIDPSRTSHINGMFLQYDCLMLACGKGKVQFCTEVNDNISAAVFTGSGEATFIPNTKEEKEQLDRYFEKGELYESELEGFVIIYTDHTYDLITGDFPMKTATVEDDAEDFLLEFKRHYVDDDMEKVYTDIAMGLLDPRNNKYVKIMLFPKSGEPMIFTYDDHSEEEVTFERSLGQIADFYATDLVNSFHKREDYSKSAIELKEECRELIQIEKCTGDLAFTSSLDVKCKYKLDIKAKCDSVLYLPFSLYFKMDVSSVTDSAGNPLDFAKGKEDGNLFIRLNEMLEKDQKTQILIESESGYMVERYKDYILRKSSIGWYPTYGMIQKSIFDITYHFPDNYELVSIGEKISEDENDDIITSRWVTQKPVSNATFNIGPFDVRKIRYDDIMPTELYYIHSKAVEDVEYDVLHAIKFYKELFGTKGIPEEFRVVENPFPGGEAFPGVINIWDVAFTGRGTADEKAEFIYSLISHEVAHQWWGIGVNFKTYHDHWLSEAFAEYSSLMYLQWILEEDEKDKFFEMLDKYKEYIINNRKSIFGSGNETGTIDLGWRNNTLRTSGDFTLLIYRKGAWVIHMLRNMLMDLNNFDESKFMSLMKEYYQTYGGKKTCTEEFQKIVEKHAGIEMGWFFDQWIKTNHIPKYKFAYDVNKVGNNKHRVTCRIRQENVPEDFKMWIPITVDYGDEKSSRFRIFMTGRDAQFDLPDLPLEPEEVTLNDFNSVLCEVEYKDYDDLGEK